MAYQLKDYYFHKAKKDNYAARSAYKLEEIDQRFKLLRVGDRVLDLGAAPGSWAQYTSRKIAKNGRIVGIDLQQIRITLPNAQFLKGDIRETDLNPYAEGGFDVVLSDMAPRTTGIKITDQARSTELGMIALEAARKYLKVRGNFVCKLFHSEDFEAFKREMRLLFDRIEFLRPKSTRKESKEIFLIGIGRKPIKEECPAPQNSPSLLS